jgi:LysM repeat protein
MNSMAPRETSSPLRLFSVIFLLVAAFLVIVSMTWGQRNLTGQGAGGTTFTQPSTFQDPNVIQIQPIPVTGECTNPYTVRDGDTLSHIAIRCNTTIAEIRLANQANIPNINVIYPGQQLIIPVDAQLPPADTVLPLLDPSPTASPTAFPTPILATPTAQPLDMTPLTEATASPAGEITAEPVSAAGVTPLLPADSLVELHLSNYPANTPVTIAIGPYDGITEVVGVAMTDDEGRLSATFTTPAASNLPILWVVIVQAVDRPDLQSYAQPFYLIEAD